jgi:hypothetical protein
MLYFMIILVLVVGIIALIFSRKTKEEPKQKEYHIFTYVVMEKEDEELFDIADEKLWELTETYPFLRPGQIFCREDRDQVTWDNDWDELIMNSHYSKEMEPYYLLFSEEIRNRKNAPKIQWDTKVLETNNIHDIKNWCEAFEKDIFKEQDSYVYHVGE